MKINRFECSNLGGITSQDISFSDGLNVVLGPNEAGKSTLVEGMFATVFKKAKLNQTKVDKEFRKRFKPYPSGDSMAGKISIDISGNEYKISKEWGATPSVSLMIDGQVVKDENAVAKRIQELLEYGENTYENIVFAKQKDIKEALDRISKDEETSTALGDLLRKAIMALDGISLEKLKKKIDEECNILQKKWDFVNNRPEGNKGFADRWKAGVGEVLSCFYEKERLSLEMKHAKEIEHEYSTVSEELKNIRKNKGDIRAQKDSLEKIEGDISQRETLELKIEDSKKKADELRQINKEYPVKELLKDTKEKELAVLRQEQTKLKEEFTLAQKAKDAKEAQELLTKIEKIEKDISGLEKRKSTLIVIEKNDIKQLEKLKSDMDTAKARMEAGTLLGKLNRASKTIYVTRGLEEREEICVGTEFSASGYIKVEIDPEIELEIKAGEIDFEELKNQYSKAESTLNEYFKEFGVSSVGEAEVKQLQFQQLIEQINKKQSEISILLGDKKKENIKEVAKEASYKNVRTPNELIALQETNNEAIINVSKEIETLKNTLKDWVEKYGDLDKVIDMLALVLKDIEDKEKQLQGLAKLPDEFKTPKEFKDYLSSLRNDYDNLIETEMETKDRLNAVENELPDQTYEELEPISKEAELKFQKQLARLHNLLKLKKVFESKLDEMDKGSFKPLTTAFSKYLSVVTLGNYDGAEITDSLSVNVIKNGTKELPVDLLSAGTYDCVLLALRLALLEYLFGGKEGMVVLDDCLVNLDPKRKKQAVELIKEFSKNNQVIFTTCDPDTASLMGGNIINL